MRVVILGAGLQAQAACFDLVQQKDVTEIVVADSDPARAAALAKRWKDPRVKPLTLDVSDEKAAQAALKGARATLSAVPYRFNASLARAAVAAGSSFCDLGGNNDVVAAELSLDAQAKAAGVTIVPDCGLAPGLDPAFFDCAHRVFEPLLAWQVDPEDDVGRSAAGDVGRSAAGDVGRSAPAAEAAAAADAGPPAKSKPRSKAGSR